MENNTKFAEFKKHFGLNIEHISFLMQRKIISHLKSEGYNITFNQFLILIFLISNDGSFQKDIVDSIFKDKSMVTRLVANLESKGFVERIKGLDDSRTVKVFILEDGKAIVNSIHHLMVNFEKKFINTIDEREFEVFNKVLSKLLDYAVESSN